VRVPELAEADSQSFDEEKEEEKLALVDMEIMLVVSSFSWLGEGWKSPLLSRSPHQPPWVN